MSVSVINYTKEMVRQGLTQDFNFYQKLTYYFELHFPVTSMSGQVVPGVSNSFMFPLVIPPESYSISEPFAVELTPTQRGGLYAEETGIIQRSIRIRGTTGFKPRMLKTQGSLGAPNIAPAPMPTTPIGIAGINKSYTRTLPITMLAEVSGQRHFQYLQDSVFRTYGDLKRDPATAKDTKLYFHNPKDDDSWLVAALKFTGDRDKEKPTMYSYNIELEVLDKADTTAEPDFDDKNILDNLNNALHMAALAEDLMAGALNDLIALQDNLETYISNFTVLLDGLTSILTATQEFTSGAEQFINVPYAWVQSMLEFMDAAVAIGADPTYPVPYSTVNMLRVAIESMELLAANPSAFEPPNVSTMTEIRNRQELRRTVSQEKQTEVLETDSPTTFEEVNALGTALTPGEVTASGGTILAGGNINKYKSVQTVEVGQGDTLATLAAQYMGDARLWQYIAVANGLKPPYVDEMASSPLSNGGAEGSPFDLAVGRGAKVLIPNNAATPKDYPTLPVLGTQIEEPVENHVLGIDALLETVSGEIVGSSSDQLDVAIDTEQGSTDVKLAEGMSNISQVILLRLLTEQGTDLMYKHVGVKRIVGLNFLIADLANARYRIREAVGADTRVAAVRNLQFEQSADGLLTDMEALLRGFSESRPIQVTL